MIEYIGIPYGNVGRDPAIGLDCWGLLRHFYAKEFGIELPSYAGAYDDSDSATQTADAISTQKSDTEWIKVDRPEYGDAVVLRCGGHACHVGVYIGGERMLHTLTGHDSAIDTTDGVRWRNRISGYFRHVSRITDNDRSKTSS